eukprot:CAMPEP_0202870226 /NCGR_PEP_ID=MMETSP1391-20130828/15046_1 /ASSEMBLY_ACC=CAM_ASM_000867 /TAXON_ID=1034604 /ORGANISM="Chlamydomonas leiostraca, Strain SAG 11-49" /LENGTH=293 /DNA_ID=CAMNT_0049550735 /DNA_START=78 /DNA_END=959 /DNA_ORIENTATION=+
MNPCDYKIRKNRLSPLKFPKVTGSDGAGVVVSAPSTSRFKAGDEVMFMAYPMWQYGSAAEYTVMPEQHVALKPASVDFVQAASLPLVANTAWQALDKAFNLHGRLDGQKVLIHGGSGGVGSMAVQLAKAKGAHVTTTCSASNEQLCRQLGADVVIDYAMAGGFEVGANEVAPEGFDAVVNAVGGDYDWRSMKCVKRGGHYCIVIRNLTADEIAAAAWGKLQQLTGRFKTHTALLIDFRAQGGFEQVAGLIDAGLIKPVVGDVMALEGAAEAQRRLETGTGSKGKLVLKIWDAR